MADIYKHVKAYFTNKEWEALSDLEKFRHTNIYENYNAHVKDGIPVQMPNFMAKKLSDKSRSVSRHKKMKRNADDNKENYKPKTKNLGDNQALRRNPRRNMRSISYFDPEVPAAHYYIYCGKCEKEVQGFCKKCDILSYLVDNEIPVGSEDRARKTVPCGILAVKPSPLHGLGVFTLRPIPKNLRMGPYEGKISRKVNDHGYCWKFSDGRVVDAENTKCSNWMRYVNCARNRNEENLMAFQFNGAIYYRTVRALCANEELLVYYGDDFARTIGLNIEAYYEPQSGPLSSVP